MSFKLDGYVTVNDRLRLALERHPDLRVTESQPRIVEIGNATFIEVAVTVFRGPDDTLPVTAHAWEPIPGKTPYTRDSEMMNASTSALGRALGMMGIGTTGSISSADEVIARQYDTAAADHPSNGRKAIGEAARRPLEAVKDDSGIKTPGKRSTPTEKMANFLKGLERKTGLEAHPDAWENFDTCRSEIDRLQGLVPQ
jgi:hypothetical protein